MGQQGWHSVTIRLDNVTGLMEVSAGGQEPGRIASQAGEREERGLNCCRGVSETENGAFLLPLLFTVNESGLHQGSSSAANGGCH